MHINASSFIASYITPFKLGIPLQIYLMKTLAGINYNKGAAMYFTRYLLSNAINCLIAVIAVA